MTVTKDDFEKVWASQSPLTPYSFSDSQYKEGWNFVGSTPPSRQMWDAFMQNADEKLKYLYQHEDIPLGHEYFTFNPNVPQGSLPLFGGEYSRETYADLWAWVQEQTGYLKTESEWQTLSTANNGNVPYYSDGDGSTTFRVPSLKCWVKGANGTVSEVGSYLAAGLPNITGQAYLNVTSTAATTAGAGSGALRGKWINNNEYGYNTGQYHGADVTLDASKSNAIYGNSTTVQPPSIIGMWLVKAYGVIVDTGQIDEQQYIDDRMADLKNVYLPANYLPLAGGNISGSLTVGNKEVERIDTRGSNYIRYESGLQLCWGLVSINVNSTASTTAPFPYRGIVTITFPVAFRGTPFGVSNVDNGSPWWTTTARAITSTTMQVEASGNEPATNGVCWFAVGNWK